MSTRLIPVCRRNKWGYIDRSGNIVVEPAFAAAGHFVDGLAMVNSGGQPGMHGLTGGQWGYLDEDGRIAIPMQFDGASDFSEGLAAVNQGARREYAPHEDDYFMRGGSVGFIDTSGAFEIPCLYEHGTPFVE